MTNKILYYVGCVSTYKLKNIARSTVKLLRYAHVDFEYTSEERCCGSILFRLGYVNETRDLMKYNMKLIRDYHVVTACAGCYFTFKNNYKVEKISHITEIIENLINEGKLKFSRVKGKIKVAYHKPCHLNNRTANLILNAIPGLQVIEIPNKCCGGGGGVRSAFEDLALNISTQRIKDVEKVNANLLVTACPFCVYNLRSIKVKSKPKVLDITEFLVTRVKH